MLLPRLLRAHSLQGRCAPSTQGGNRTNSMVVQVMARAAVILTGAPAAAAGSTISFLLPDGLSRPFNGITVPYFTTSRRPGH